MTDITDLDQIVPTSAKKARRSLARRADRVSNTETLRSSLDRVVDELGFSAGDGIAAPRSNLD